MTTSFPSLTAVYSNPPTWLIVFWAIASACTLFILLHWMYMVSKVIKHHRNVRLYMLIIASTLPVIAVTNLLTLFIINGEPVFVFISALYESVFFAIFFKLVVLYHGGWKAFVETLLNLEPGKHFAVVPFRILSPCVKAGVFTPRKIVIFTSMILSFSITRTITFFIAMVLGLILVPGNSFYLIITVINVIFALFGVYGLSVFIKVTRDLLPYAKVGRKFITVKIIFAIVILTGFIYSLFGKFNVLDGSYVYDQKSQKMIYASFTSIVLITPFTFLVTWAFANDDYVVPKWMEDKEQKVGSEINNEDSSTIETKNNNNNVEFDSLEMGSVTKLLMNVFSTSFSSYAYGGSNFKTTTTEAGGV